MKNTSTSLTKIAVMVMFVCLFGCKTGSQAYKKGDYYTACMQAIERLRSSPTNKQSISILQTAYPLAQQMAMRDVDNALAYKDARSYDLLVKTYTQMNNLADAINRCPAALNLIPNPTEYYTQLVAAKQRAAEYYYTEGEKALNMGTMEQARIAYNHFLKANEYVPDYKDLYEKIIESRELGTLRVVVQPPIVSNRYQIDADFFYTKLMSDITRRTYKHLVRFYTPEEAMAEQLYYPHQELILNFEDFTVGNVRETSNTTEMVLEDVEIGVTKVDDKEQKVYGTVKAKFTSYRIELISEGVLSMQIVDPSTRRVINQQAFSNRTVWSSEWGSFNGDERALTNAQLNLVKKRRLTPPSQQDLFVSFANGLFTKATNQISYIY